MTPHSFPALVPLRALLSCFTVCGTVGCSLTSEPFTSENTAPSPSEQLVEQAVNPGRPGTVRRPSPASTAGDPRASTGVPRRIVDAGSAMRSEGLSSPLPLAPTAAAGEGLGSNPAADGADASPPNELESPNGDSPPVSEPARCDDALANGDESDVDCGGTNPFCPQCSDGSTCRQDEDCENENCFDGICISCGSGTLDGDETDVDCGGSDPFCQRCQDGRQCRTASDCNNNNCFNGVCISCGSGTIDGDETDIDCGGADPFCRRCEPGLRCRQNSDCQSGVCTNGFC